MKRRPRCVALALLVGLAMPLAAQDVIVGEPAPLRAPNDPLPSTFARLRPAFPDELRDLPEPGYVIALRYDAADREILERTFHGTHLWFQRAVEDAKARWIFTPAKRGRKYVDSHIWLAVIFNPKTAAEKIPDATPRLLAVAPVFLPLAQGAKRDAFVLRVPVSLDAAGAIIAIEPRPALEKTVDAAMRASLAKWRFAPARRGGKPIATTITVPVLCQPVDPEFFQRIPPKPLARPSLGYPATMHNSGLRAEVTLAFDVDATGTVRNPTVVTSTHPGFDATALASLRAWKYRPASVEGQPVAVTGLRTTFRYDNPRGSHDGFVFRDGTDQAKLPPDGPKQGDALVQFLVDHDGLVRLPRIVSASDEVFGYAAVQAISVWQFEKPKREGKPVVVRAQIPFKFLRSEPEPVDAPGS